MDEKNGCLPIIDTNEKLVELITESNIFRTIVKKWREENIISAGLK